MNPFIVSGFAGSKYFCDRKKELEKLKEAFTNNRNITLFSIRRMGKSSLIQYLFEERKKNTNCIYLDIYPSNNFQDFVQIFANSLTKFYGYKIKEYLSNFSNLVKSLNATISFDGFTGNPEIKIGLGNFEKQKDNFLKIIEFLEKSKKRIYLAIDEFQTVVNYPEKNTIALLRTYFQQCENINFIFSGSNNRIMQSLFANKTSPFYQSTQFLMLEEIEYNEYKKFIKNHFLISNFEISDEQIDIILTICRRHTYYVQLLCNRLYSQGKDVTKEDIAGKLFEILHENEPVYQNYKNLLTELQWMVLKAISAENEVRQPFSIKFIKEHNLSSPSSVTRAITSLLEKNIIVYYKDRYIIEDVFFSLWLKKY